MEDHSMRNLFIGLGGFFVAFILFITLIVVPDINQRRERCEAAGGQIIKGGTCISDQYILNPRK